MYHLNGLFAFENRSNAFNGNNSSYSSIICRCVCVRSRWSEVGLKWFQFKRKYQCLKWWMNLCYISKTHSQTAKEEVKEEREGFVWLSKENSVCYLM